MNELRWASPADDETVAGRVAGAVDAGGAIAVPGGATPAPILAALAKRPIQWQRVTVTPTDEREVPSGHPASNFGALRAALGATGALLAPLKEGPAPGRFRLVWLGMGADGHVASIFPGAELPVEAPPAVVRTVPEPLPPEAPFPRLTLNYAALLDSEELILVVRGAAKRRLIEQAIAGANDLPVARLLRAAKAPVTVYWSES
jgi:6-phosphogluconolactonase